MKKTRKLAGASSFKTLKEIEISWMSRSGRWLGAGSVSLKKLKLKAASEYNYLNQSNCLTIDRIDDSQKFHKLMEAFNTVQIPQEYQERALALLAAVLWLGNVSFEVIDNENHVDVVADEASYVNGMRLKRAYGGFVYMQAPSW
ncbi:hypothetical protein HID58_003029 [Brassica napus]|uniref:Myosin motor domain-containing protein n=1 Tax=Brassica napus TaxID=3708 RepID=A0ABQ8ENY7_BRANA|nr:hypothetical protein HID58_003029 [Brassica napus]